MPAAYAMPGTGISHFDTGICWPGTDVGYAATEDISCHLYRLLHVIHEAQRAGGKVLVHCHQVTRPPKSNAFNCSRHTLSTRTARAEF
eukprot:855365-Rhodomonas_salina.1